MKTSLKSILCALAVAISAPLPVAKIADSMPKAGDSVMYVGFPDGQGPYYSKGAWMGERVTDARFPGKSMERVSMSVRHGASGSGVYRESDGKLVGQVSQMAGADETRVVPAADVQRFVEDVRLAAAAEAGGIRTPVEQEPGRTQDDSTVRFGLTASQGCQTLSLPRGDGAQTSLARGRCRQRNGRNENRVTPETTPKSGHRATPQKRP